MNITIDEFTWFQNSDKLLNDIDFKLRFQVVKNTTIFLK
jgi:hypothetical protein